MRTLTIKGRITLLYALLTALLLAVLLPVVYGAVSASLRREMDSQLCSAIAQVLIAVDDQDEAFRLNQQVDLPDAITLCVTDPQGQPIFSTAGGEWLQTAAIQPDGKTVHQNETYTVRQETVQIEGATVTASAAISAGSAEASLHTLQVLLGILVPIYLALAIAGAYLLAKRAIRPITEITKAAETIRAGDLSQRITGIATQDEIQELADTFNTMLHRLQAFLYPGAPVYGGRLPRAAHAGGRHFRLRGGTAKGPPPRGGGGTRRRHPAGERPYAQDPLPAPSADPWV